VGAMETAALYCFVFSFGEEVFFLPKQEER
jgi:hypothetical protein